jgi:hypothetical protein
MSTTSCRFRDKSDWILDLIWGARIKHGYYVTGLLCSPEDPPYRNWRLTGLKTGDILSYNGCGSLFHFILKQFLLSQTGNRPCPGGRP